ncbi:MAG TPA: glucose 1-dehydrogenase [Acidimicrobiales bacterium]|nr:glucose 1-dehydrogenase [Acidimicrobiales bacterium]
MKALTVIPLKQGSAALIDMEEPPETDGAVLVETIGVGICGTDIEILSGEYGWAPPGEERLVLGHESLGKVIEAPDGSGFQAGDHVVGIVRAPDPVPCTSCAVGEWDMCRNGQYTEHGIKELHGFCREHYRISPEHLVKVDPMLGMLGVLLEPATILAKAWDHVEKIGNRAHWVPSRVVVTGAGPVGLMAALMGVQRGMEVHVIDQVTDGPKPALVAELGAKYHTGLIEDACPSPDVVIECTGAGSLVFDAMEHIAAGGVLCLTGVSAKGRTIGVDAGELNRYMVLENEAVVGSVNANRSHYEAGAKSLRSADPKWLEKLITRRVPLQSWQDALDRKPDDVKVVIEIGEG